MSASESVMDFVNDTHMRHLVNETARQQKCDYTMYQRPIEPIAYYVYLFILPVVNLIGVMIEVVCFIVFTKKQMRQGFSKVISKITIFVPQVFIEYLSCWIIVFRFYRTTARCTYLYSDGGMLCISKFSILISSTI